MEMVKWGRYYTQYPDILNVPLTIPHKERLVITGESFIPTNDFERLKDTLRDGNGNLIKTDVILLPDQFTKS